MRTWKVFSFSEKRIAWKWLSRDARFYEGQIYQGFHTMFVEKFPDFPWP